MGSDTFDHGLPDNPYNKHAWILGNPEIGERVWIGAFCLIDGLHATLKIGRGTDISSGAKILTHSTVQRCISENRYPKVDSAPTEIGEFCFIGTNAVVLKGCNIGHHSVIGAGAVVLEDTKIPPYSLVVGIPAKIVGSSKKFLKNLENNSLSVVIPAFNEAETIKTVVDNASKVLKTLKIDYEIVCVNDGSIDKTGKIIDDLAKKDKHIRTVHHTQNRGFTGAMRTSFQNAREHLVFLAPADGQFDFEELPKFLEAIKGYDVAIAYRVKNEDYEGNLIRKINTWGFHWLSRTLFDIHLKEFSTVSMWRRRVLHSIEIKSEDRSAMMLPELIHKALRKKYKFTQVPINWYFRKGGKAKGVGVKTIIKTLQGMLKLWYNLKFRSS